MKSFYLFVFVLLGNVLFAQKPGTLDESYGNNKGGNVSTNKRTLLFCSAIQVDDKIVAGGEDSNNSRFVLERFNKDGSIDTSFGVKGKVITDIDLLDYKFGVGNGWTCIAVQPDGKIVTAGMGDKYNEAGGNDLFNTDIITARFLADGTPDTSFGLAGKATLDLGVSDNASAIGFQKDGKIVIAGDASGKLLLVRYNADGTQDQDFGTSNGYTLYPNTGTHAYALAIQPDGKIIAGGSANLNTNLLLTRYLPNGITDSQFGNNGTVTTSIGYYFSGIYINSLAIDETGKIVASGNTQDNEGNNQIAVLRYLPDGTLDKLFDEDGKKTIVFGGINGYSTKVLLPNADKIILAGYTYADHPEADFALATLNTDGSFDSAFGTNGETSADFGHDETTCGAVLQSDGKIVLTASDLNDLSFINTNSRYYGYSGKIPLPVKIKRWLHNHALMYPNPARESVTVNGLSSTNKTTIVINNTLGTTMAMYNTANASLYTFDISKLVAGVYYIQVITKGERQSLKFVKE